MKPLTEQTKAELDANLKVARDQGWKGQAHAIRNELADRLLGRSKKYSAPLDDAVIGAAIRGPLPNSLTFPGDDDAK